ncbi:MAG: polysaccharide export protein [Elusimicrobiota bacterium]
MTKKIISIFIIILFFSQSTLFSIDLPSGVQILNSDYRISNGDVLSINISPAEEFSKEITVSPDGTIDLALLGGIKVSGMKISEIENLLSDMYSKYVANPRVTVSVRKFSAYKVAIIGQIQRSGYYEYSEGMKLLDLIAASGGPTDYADSKNIKVYRKLKDKQGKIKEEIFAVSMESFFKGSLDKNIELMPGDIVYIPRQKFTSTTKWISDNIIPWTILATFAMSVGIIARK